MILNSINILNYKNIAEAQLQFAPKVNCLIGNNGMGKTNILDAIYYLSFCRSFSTLIDAAVINHDAPFAMIQGNYLRNEAEEQISISIQRGKRKVAKRNGKEYKRLSQHIGLLPIVMISPMDWDLIRGAGEERRKLMDVIISQGNPVYLDALIRYGKALEQRNSMIKHEFRDPLLYETVELQLCEAAAVIHKAREQWIREFEPIFMHYYQAIAGSAEQVNLSYSSHLNDATMEQHLNTTAICSSGTPPAGCIATISCSCSTATTCGRWGRKASARPIPLHCVWRSSISSSKTMPPRPYSCSTTSLINSMRSASRALWVSSVGSSSARFSSPTPTAHTSTRSLPTLAVTMPCFR